VQYYKNAITVPGPEIDRIAEIAKELDIFIVTGFIEQTPGTLYCSVGFFHPKNGFLYRRRKASTVVLFVKPGLRILQ
jgi:predicted amidohydrolase